MLKANLNDVLKAIAKQLSLPSRELIQYAQEAPYAAQRPDGNLWPSGTGSENEKRILYAIAYALNAVLSLDIGTRWGSSALQIASADDSDLPPKWRVISVDKERFIHGTKHKVGKFIPEKLGVELETSDAVVYLRKDNKVYNLIYEDTDHTFEMTKAVYELAIDRLVPGGVIISHDACHPKFKGAIVRGIKAVGIEPEVYLVEGDSCGLAIWQKPKKEVEKPVEKTKIIVEEDHIYGTVSDVKPPLEPYYAQFPEAEEEVPSPIHIDNPPKRKKRQKKLKPVVPKKETSL